jgi:hypothetical protein
MTKRKRTTARLPGESDEEYEARLIREAPLSEEAQIEIREAADWYWATLRREEAERERPEEE